MKIALHVLGIALWAGGAAYADTAQTLITRIDSLYHATPHWRVQFEQTVRYPVFDETEEESGTLTVGPEGRFRLSTDRHVVVSDGDTLWSHNRRANQVTLDRVDDAGEVVRPADFLFQFKQDYESQLCDHTGPGRCLYLRATDETAFIREMWLWVETRTAHVKRAVYKDVNLNETTFKFTRIDFVIQPAESEFHYDPPPGVEIIRMP